jgi:hypothetical protein
VVWLCHGSLRRARAAAAQPADPGVAAVVLRSAVVALTVRASAASSVVHGAAAPPASLPFTLSHRSAAADQQEPLGRLSDDVVDVLAVNVLAAK